MLIAQQDSKVLSRGLENESPSITVGHDDPASSTDRIPEINPTNVGK
jgi:hypothetical protein